MQMFHKANPDVVNSEIHELCTPLVVASLNDSNDCFKYLAEVADVSAKHLMYKVICRASSEESSMERVRILLDCGVNPNSYDAVTLFEGPPILCAAKRGWKNLVGILLSFTAEIPGIEWTIDGVMEHVSSELFQQTDQEQGTKRVCALKDRMLRALKDMNYLAADIICKVLYVDMDREEWDRYHSLCSFLIFYGMKSMFPTPTIDAEAIFALSWMLDVSKETERVLLGAKACVALEPDNERYKEFLVHVTKNDGR